MEPHVLIWRVSTAACLTLAALLAWPLVQRLREPPPPPPPTLRFSFPVPPGVELGVGDDGLDIAIAPREDEVVFVGTSEGVARLWRRPFDAERATPLAGTEGARLPAWSPDGADVSFFTGPRLRALTLQTGAVRDLAQAPGGLGAAWLADGSLVFSASPDAPLSTLRSGQVTAATALQPGDRGHAFPSPVDGGFLYIAIREDGRRIIRLQTGGQTRELGATDAHAVAAGTFLLHVRGGALLAQRLDPAAGALSGRAVPVALDAGAANGRGLFAASPRFLIVSAAATRARELAWFDLQGRRAGAASDRGDYWQVRLAPNDSTAAVTQLEPLLRTLDIYVVPLQPGHTRSGLSLALAADTDPVWSPDGLQVLFRSLQDGQPNLFTRLVEREGAPIDAALRSDADEVPDDWRSTPSGPGEVIYHAAPAGRDTDLLVLDMKSGTSRQVLRSTGFNESEGRWSPDGRWLAYVSDEFGQPDVFVQAWPDGERTRVTLSGGLKPRWGRDSRTLFFLRGTDISSAARQAGPALSFSAPQTIVSVAGLRDFDLAHRTGRLLAVVPAGDDSRAEGRVLVDWQTVAAAATDDTARPRPR